MNDLMSSIIQSMSNQEELIISQMFFEKTGKDISQELEIDKKRKFSKFLKTIDGNQTTIWYNDNTLQGLRIITYYFDYGHDKPMFGAKFHAKIQYW